MTNIAALKQTLQQDLEPRLQEKAATTKEYNDIAAKLAPIEERLSQMHGVSRLKKPFIKATKVAPLHHKQKKLDEKIVKEDVQIAKAINSVFGDLGTILIQDPTFETSFKYLRDSFDAVESAKHTVLRAAKKCQHAATAEYLGGEGPSSGFNFNEKNMITDVIIGAAVQLNAKRAAKWVKKAQTELKSLQEKLKDAPQINSQLAKGISRQSNFAFMMDSFGGFMSFWGNINAAADLSNAKYQLRDAAHHLDKLADSLVNDEMSLLMTIAAQARETDPYVGQILSSLEKYIPANPPAAKPQQKPDGAKPR